MISILRIKTSVCREPFRLFFPLGVLMGSWGVGQWLFLSLGWISSSLGFYHSSVQSLVYMNCFIIGFLTTALPRFTATRQATGWEISSFFFLIIGMLLFLSLQEWVIAEILFAVWLIALMRFALVRVTRRPKTTDGPKPPLELIWVPFGVFNGITGVAASVLGQMGVLPPWSLKAGRDMMEQGFLLSVVVGIGGFLIPRLLGTYRRAQEHEQACEVPQEERKAYSLIIYAVCMAMIFVSFWLEGLGFAGIAYALRALAVTIVYSMTGIFKFVRGCDLYARLIWVSAWMVAIGYWLAAIFSNYGVIMLHITFIGGFSLMTFSVASMVILSHSGEGARLKRPLWILWMVGLGIGAAMVQRIMVAFFPDQYMQILGIAAALWIMAAFGWLAYMLPFIFRVPEEDTFGKMHEEVKST